MKNVSTMNVLAIVRLLELAALPGDMGVEHETPPLSPPIFAHIWLLCLSCLRCPARIGRGFFRISLLFLVPFASAKYCACFRRRRISIAMSCFPLKQYLRITRPISEHFNVLVLLCADTNYSSGETAWFPRSCVIFCVCLFFCVLANDNLSR